MEIVGQSVLWSAQLHLHAGSPHGWDPQLEAHPKGDSDPGGPNDTRRIITNQKQQIKYPCYRIRDTQSLKDKQMHDNVQLPSSRGTMTRTLTLQVTRNRQHDTSRPSIQPNHQDYVSVSLLRGPRVVARTLAHFCGLAISLHLA